MSDAHTPGELEIGPLRRKHLRAVMAIEPQVYSHPWTHSLFLSELALPASRVYLVARAGRAVVGYAGLMLAPDEAHVTTIAVDPEWRRRRVATRLLVSLTREAASRNYDAMTLEVRLGRWVTRRPPGRWRSRSPRTGALRRG